MKLDASDVKDLEPLIRLAVHAMLEQVRADEGRLDRKRLAFTEPEAAAMLGVPRHRLRDARLRGEISAKLLGKGYLYSREELLRFLGMAPTE